MKFAHGAQFSFHASKQYRILLVLDTFKVVYSHKLSSKDTLACSAFYEIVLRLFLQRLGEIRFTHMTVSSILRTPLLQIVSPYPESLKNSLKSSPNFSQSFSSDYFSTLQFLSLTLPGKFDKLFKEQSMFFIILQQRPLLSTLFLRFSESILIELIKVSQISSEPGYYLCYILTSSERNLKLHFLIHSPKSIITIDNEATLEARDPTSDIWKLKFCVQRVAQGVLKYSIFNRTKMTADHILNDVLH